MGDMPKEQMPVSPERGPVAKLRESVAQRKRLFDRLAGSPWAWAAAAVMALESQTGCATVVRGACYAAVEPGCSGIDYDTSVGKRPAAAESGIRKSQREGQTLDASRDPNARQGGGVVMPGGGLEGVKVEVKALPPRGSASIQSMPEGFYAPSVARAVKEKKMKAPPSFINLEAANYRPGSEIFSVAHAEVEENVEQELRSVRHDVFRRGLRYVLPYLEYDQGIRAEWQSNRRVGQDRTFVSCRVTASNEPAYLRRNAPLLRGESLEHSILTDQRKLEGGRLYLTENGIRVDGGRIYFSSEKSGAFPDRPAQAASMMWIELPSEFFEAKAKKDQAVWRVKEISAKMDALNKECLYKKSSDPAFRRKCAELDSLDAEYIKLNAEIAQLTKQMEPLAKGIQGAKLTVMERLAVEFEPHFGSGNQLKYFVRFDWAGQKLQVIALLDNPVPASGK